MVLVKHSLDIQNTNLYEKGEARWGGVTKHNILNFKNAQEVHLSQYFYIFIK